VKTVPSRKALKFRAEKAAMGRYTAHSGSKARTRKSPQNSFGKAELIPMVRVFTIPVPPNIVARKRRESDPDPRYVDGQRQLVEAMRYLAQADPVANREAIQLISEHVRTRFRMTDSPLISTTE
jgi:hypothetical protein